MGVWDGQAHTAVFNMENQQGPAGQHRELCSILCNDLMVTRGKDGGRDSQGVWDGHGHTAVFNMENRSEDEEGLARSPSLSLPSSLCGTSDYEGRTEPRGHT